MKIGPSLGDHILVTTDFSDGSLEAAKAVQAYLPHLAGNPDNGSQRVTLLAVVDMAAALSVPDRIAKALPISTTAYDEELARVRNELTLAAAHCFGSIPVHCEVLTSRSDVASAICDYAKAEQVTLIAIASHGRKGFQHFLFGSITEAILSRAQCPTLVVSMLPTVADSGSDSGFDHAKRFIVLTDLSPAGEAIFPVAADLYRSFGSGAAHMTLVTVLEDPFRASFGFSLGSQRELILAEQKRNAQTRLAELVTKYFSHTLVETAVLSSRKSVHEGVIDFVHRHGVDTILLSRHGLDSDEHVYLGSMTYKLLRDTTRELLVVPHS